MAGMAWFARTCGALLVLLGIWGGLISFVGPYFHYAYTPDRAWAYTTGRLWLEILPALGTLAGGVTIMISAVRSTVLAGAWLAAISGGWLHTHKQRQFTPLPVAVHIAKTDFAQPVQLRLNVEKLVRRILVLGLEVKRG